MTPLKRPVFLALLFAAASAVVVVVASRWGGIDGVSWVGTVASLLGLGVSLYTANAVRELRAQHLNRVMLAECYGRLTSHLRSIRIAISRSQVETVRLHISKTVSVLERISLHDESQTIVNFEVSSLREVAKSQADLLIPRVQDLLPIIHERLTYLELKLEAMNWGSTNG
jgi:hypothetical protein